MRVLLPPSESKRPGGGSDVYRPDLLAFSGALGHARETIQSALVKLSAHEDSAAVALKVGVKARSEIKYNLQLDQAGTLPAIERYTGVLYDAIEFNTLNTTQRQWVDDHVMIQSALFGLIRANDCIPAYRLSANSRLTTIGTPLKRLWKTAHEAIDWTGVGWVLDLRSLDYATLATLPDSLPSVRVAVAQRTKAGEVKALNHFNKAAKGDLIRRLAQSAAVLSTPKEFIEWAHKEGLELNVADKENVVTLVTTLGAPART